MQITLDSWMVVPSNEKGISIVGISEGKLVRQLISSFTKTGIVTKKDRFALGTKMPGSWGDRLAEFRPAKAEKMKSLGII
ncbi:MAG: hypothetical protein PHV02_07220 [Rhodocyclaceae bacterium]|nr:hypothetical protein [Rhodocyclaceae bacterium]